MSRAPVRPLVLVALCALPILAVSAGARQKGKIHMAKPRHGCQIDVGPVPVERGKEITECTYFKLPSKKDMAVNRVQIKVSGGSHHVHIYRPQDPSLSLPDGHEACNMALDFSVWQLVLASQSQYLDWHLPPGIAFNFKAGEQLAAQTHFVDSGLLKTPFGQGWAIFNLHTTPLRKVKSFAGSFFGQDRDVVVPPHTTSTATTRCVFPKPVTLLAITGHYHYRGVHFSAGTWDGQSGNEIYSYDGYLDPPFVRFSEKQPTVVQGLQWTCTYVNNDDVTYKFGPFTDVNEHCNMFAFYYPTDSAHEGITCVQKDGVATTVVRDN